MADDVWSDTSTSKTIWQKKYVTQGLHMYQILSQESPIIKVQSNPGIGAT